MVNTHPFRTALDLDKDAVNDERETPALISSAAQGNLVAFERLYRRYSPQVYGLCLRLTGQREAAEDCTQDCFVDAWRALGRFQGRSAFETWLHAIAVRRVLSRRRGMRASLEVLLPGEAMPDTAEFKTASVTGDLSGSGHVTLGTQSRLHFKSTSGDLHLTLGISGDAHIEGESVSGDVSLLFREVPAADFDVQTHSGERAKTVSGRNRRNLRMVPDNGWHFGTVKAGRETGSSLTAAMCPSAQLAVAVTSRVSVALRLLRIVTCWSDSPRSR